MRVVFGALSLLIALAMVGILAKKQLAAVPPAKVAAPVDGSAVAIPSGTPQQQVQQFQRAVEGAMQQARPMPEDK